METTTTVSQRAAKALTAPAATLLGVACVLSAAVRSLQGQDMIAACFALGAILWFWLATVAHEKWTPLGLKRGA